MSDVPAGWYDDPEDPSQYRYWDGTQWSEHRSPRSVGGSSGGASAGTDVGSGALADGWNLLRRNWLAFVAISALAVVIILITAVAVFFTVNNAVTPSIVDVIDRVTDSDFDPVEGSADEAFLESIEFTPGAGFWVLMPALVALLVFAQAFIIGLGAVHVAADHVGRPRQLSESFRTAMRRLPRWVGVYLLWVLAYVAVLALAALLTVLSGGFALILLVPGGLGLVIWLYPTLFLMGTALAVGPTDEPPFRTTFALMREGWRRLAWPVLLVNLTLFGISIAIGIVGAVPILGAIVSFFANLVIYAYIACVNVSLWTRVGGRVGVDIGGGDAPVS